LGDGINPTYACFVKTIPNPTTRMQKMFATAQEAKRKDIEGTSRMKKYSIAHIIVNNSVNKDFRHDVLIEGMRCSLSIQNFCI
jgi:hypothetical protein